MTKKPFIILPLFALIFTSCETRRCATTFDEGVVINGIRWATRNVDMPGTFAQNPENTGMFFQWNRKKGWSATGEVQNWDSSNPEGTEWYAENDPCPEGWRVPTREELVSLKDTENEWVTKNGINGRFFGTTPNQLFLPAGGGRSNNAGSALFGVGSQGFYWSGTQGETAPGAWHLQIGSDNTHVFSNDRDNGFSVRCVAIE